MTKRVLSAVLTALLCVVLIGCSKDPLASLEGVTITNSVEMKYTPADMSGYTLLEEDPAEYRLVSMEEACRLFSEGGTGILYYGKVGCDWCQRAVAELNKAAVKANVPIWYADVAKHVTTDVYEETMYYIADICPLDEAGMPAFYAPSVIGIKDGKIVSSHISLVDSVKHVDENTVLTDSQKKELQECYRDLILAVADN